MAMLGMLKSLTIIEDMEMNNTLIAIHPGEILREEYLQPLGLSPYQLAKELHIPRTRIERLVAEKTPVTLDTALRLARFFNTTAQYWLNMQMAYDVKTVPLTMQDELAKIHTHTH